MSKNVKIIVIVACFFVAAIIFYFTSIRRSVIDTAGNEKIWFKCVNPKCQASFAFTATEVSKQQSNELGQQAFKCRDCGENSASMAQKCRKCDEIFIMKMVPGYRDRCPKCKYSYIEEMEKTQK